MAATSTALIGPGHVESKSLAEAFAKNSIEAVKNERVDVTSAWFNIKTEYDVIAKKVDTRIEILFDLEEGGNDEFQDWLLTRVRADKFGPEIKTRRAETPGGQSKTVVYYLIRHRFEDRVNSMFD